MGTETNKDERNTPEYLAQLLKDKKQIQAFPNVFVHLEKLLDEEINRVRLQLFHHKGNGRAPLELPEQIGPIQTLSEKLYVPVKEHPDFNFVGRILGPRGMTAKELEQYTGCKIMVRGKGSMRDKKKEEQNRGKPNWEHLNEELHVLITVEDTKNRGDIKMAKAMEEVKKLLIPAPDGEDDLKKRQLMELAIINGTYRDTSKPATSQTSQPSQGSSTQFGFPWNSQLQTMQMLGQLDGIDHKSILNASSSSEPARLIAAASPLTAAGIPSTLRSSAPAGAPLILAPRLPQVATSTAGMLSPPPLVSPSDSAATAGLMYNPYEYPYSSLHPAAAIVEYPTTLEQAGAGAVPKIRRTLEGVRAHPYTRVTLP